MSEPVPQGTGILDRMRQEDPGAAERVDPVTGSDRHGLVEVTMDFERTVSAVRVTDIGQLRTPDGLSTAVISAFQDADLQRAAASLEASGSVERVLAEAGGGEHPPRLTPPRVGDVSYRAHRAGELGHRSSTITPTPPAGRSDNGFVTVQRDATGAILWVEADTEWLTAARPEYLQDALLQAFALDREGA